MQYIVRQGRNRWRRLSRGHGVYSVLLEAISEARLVVHPDALATFQEYPGKPLANFISVAR
jgi:hypothetical protein